MDFFDAHFHVWNVTNGKHAPELKGSKFPDYTMKVHEEQLNIKGFNLVGGAWIECISLVPQEEAEWISKELDPKTKLSNPNLALSIVCGGDLMSPNAAKEMAALKKADPRVVGMRQILNFEPSWPRNKTDFLQNPAFEKGYKALESLGMSFDAQLNPAQFKSMYTLAKKYPKIPVIVNHMGTPKLDDEKQSESVWEDGMMKLASLPHVAVKISMLGYVDKNWDKSPAGQMSKTKEMIYKTIKLFGTDRVMFASNFPVDLDTFNGCHLLNAFLDTVKDSYSRADQEKMFSKNGLRIYRAASPKM